MVSKRFFASASRYRCATSDVMMIFHTSTIWASSAFSFFVAMRSTTCSDWLFFFLLYSLMTASACAFSSRSSFSSLNFWDQFLKTRPVRPFMFSPRVASSFLRASSFWFFNVEAMVSASFRSLKTSAQKESHAFQTTEVRPVLLAADMRFRNCLASSLFLLWKPASFDFVASTSSLAFSLFFQSFKNATQAAKQVPIRPEAWPASMRLSTAFDLSLCLRAILCNVALTASSSLSHTAFLSSRTALALSSSSWQAFELSKSSLDFSSSSLAFLNAARKELYPFRYSSCAASAESREDFVQVCVA
mmetsp:Transcript_17574/g.55356  ORF Transcript_17574/g.55356 Transcript_17574/m.55356 type:complete len:303 (+) Transcript_17574:309-1217(+)